MEVLGFMLSLLIIVFILFGFLQVSSWMYLLALGMYVIGGIAYCIAAGADVDDDDLY